MKDTKNGAGTKTRTTQRRAPAACVTLTLNEKQAEVVADALDFHSRLGMCQFGEISSECIHAGVKGADGNRLGVGECERLREMCEEMSRLFGFSGSGHAHAIGSQHVPEWAKRAFEVKKVLDKTLAEHRNPSPSFRGVQYDGLIVRYTNDPVPLATVAASPKTGDPTNEDRANRLRTVLGTASLHGYAAAADGVRNLIADALHLATATGANPASESRWGFDHWLVEALETAPVPATALDAASFDQWQDVFYDGVSVGEYWRPQFRLTQLASGQFEILDERENAARPRHYLSVEEALDAVIGSYYFDPHEVFSLLPDTNTALSVLALINNKGGLEVSGQ